MKKVLIFMNLGGPDSPEAVKPFLFNLFNDKAILTIPNPFRFLLAWLISTLRNKKAQKIYGYLGGKSPIYEQTLAQSEKITSLVQSLDKNSQYSSFVAMRYWKPRVSEIIEKIEKIELDEIILVPLYPQFSTTTTGSAIDEFYEIYKKSKLNCKIKALGCFPVDDKFIESQVKVIREKIKNLPIKNKKIIFFSAHSLPQKIIDDGDPYQYQTEETAKRIWEKLKDIENLEHKVTYQSKVGLNKWLGPSSEEEIISAAKENKTIIIYPISFVSEHSETLVELDIQYKELAQENGCNEYVRIPTMYLNDGFSKFLAERIIDISKKENNKKLAIYEANFKRICPNEFTKCRCEE